METINEFTPDEFLKTIKEVPTVPFHKFELLTSKYGESCLYCFVEGHDLPYYSVRVEAIASMSCYCIDSGGKKNVIAINEFLREKEEYFKYKTLYMVDKDYDDNSKLNESIYVTPCYSVENLYCVNNIVDKLFCMSPEDSKYDECHSYIKDKYDQFISAISLFCTWYYSNKEFERNNKIILDIALDENMDSKFLNYIVDEQDIVIDAHYSLDDINNYYNTSISLHDIEANSHFINEYNIRGKYLFQFFEKLLIYFNMDSSKKGPHKFFKKNLAINTDRKKMMTTLNCIATTPKELKEYIQKYIA